MSRGPDGRIARVRSVLPRHKAANWVGPGRGRKSTRPGANGVVELTPFEFLDRLADLVLPPRKHRHCYHGVFAPNHKLRRAVISLAIGNIGKRREAATGGPGGMRRFGEPSPNGRHAQSRCSRVVRQPEDRCGSAIDRATFTFSVEQPVTWPDFHATVLHLLGIDHTALMSYHNGIERRLTNVHGQVIECVVA